MVASRIKIRCCKCKLVLPYSCFYSGTTECKNCQRVRQRTPHYLELKKIRNKRWNEANKIKVKAHAVANYRIRIPVNQICTMCNKRLAKEKHHYDYTKPLDVIFLCVKCHTSVTRGKVVVADL